MRRAENKVVVLSGGIDAIADATIRRFASVGATITLLEPNEDKSREYQKNLKREKIYVDVYNVNITEFNRVESVASQIYSQYKHIDILINNPNTIRLNSGGSENWQQLIEISLSGLLNCIKAFSYYMIKGSWGRIINTTALLGLYGDINQAHYISVKNGVLGISKIWTSELGKYGITVNTVAPGYIENDYLTQSSQAVLKSIKEKIPLQKIGKPEDVAEVYLFLSSDKAGYISGNVINVDGGYML